jgi:hypothetical protein
MVTLVRICCIGLVCLHHLFYKGVAGPLGLPPHLYVASPGAGPLGLQGRLPIRVSGGAASPRCRLHWRRLPWPPPSWPPALGGPSPLYIVPTLEQYRHPIPLLSHGNQSQFFFSLPLTLAAASSWTPPPPSGRRRLLQDAAASAWPSRRLLLDAAASTGSL